MLGIRGWTTGVGVFALGAAALLAGTASAVAAPATYGNIEPDRAASLTVHKYLHQNGSFTGDPSQQPADGDFSDPVAGVTFTAYPLIKNGSAVDLTDSAVWPTLKDITPGAGCTAPAGYTLGTPVALPKTDATGTATAALSQTVYQVCETDAPANIVDMALPFIVTLPMPYENGWVYDVQAYPKNGAGEIVKTVSPQQDMGLGSVVTFPVTSPIPTMQDVWKSWAITDVLDARLTPEGTGVGAVTVDGSPLDPSYYTASVQGQKVIVEFTNAGVAWLNEGHAGAKVTIDFQGKITAVGDGTIENQADLWVNNPDRDPSVRPPLPSNEVATHWGSLQVLKRAAGTTPPVGARGDLRGLEVLKRAAGTTGEPGRLLEGAVFNVYQAADPYATDCSAATKTGAPVSVNGVTDFVSGGDGVISVKGLFVSDSENDPVDAPQRCYVLVEVKAPAGYVLPANPDSPVTVKIGATPVTANVAILNTQAEVPELPLTGAKGELLLISFGAAAVILAIVLIAFNRRRKVLRD